MTVKGETTGVKPKWASVGDREEEHPAFRALCQMDQQFQPVQLTSGNLAKVTLCHVDATVFAWQSCFWQANIHGTFARLILTAQVEQFAGRFPVGYGYWLI